MEYRRSSLNPWDDENPLPYQRYRRALEQEHATYQYDGSVSTWSVMWTGLQNLMCWCFMSTAKHASS